MGAAWTRKEGQNPEGGLNAKGRASYKRETGGTLKAPVSRKAAKKSPKKAKRRKSFCARMTGQKKMHGISCKEKPDSRICKSLRKWDCNSFDRTLDGALDTLMEANWWQNAALAAGAAASAMGLGGGEAAGAEHGVRPSGSERINLAQPPQTHRSEYKYAQGLVRLLEANNVNVSIGRDVVQIDYKATKYSQPSDLLKILAKTALAQGLKPGMTREDLITQVEKALPNNVDLISLGLR